MGAFITPTSAFDGRHTVMQAFAKVFRLFRDPDHLVKLDNINHRGVELGLF